MDFAGHLTLVYRKQVLEDFNTIYITKRFAASSFGMWHHTHNISFFVADPRDIIGCAIGIAFRAYMAFFIAVLEYYLVICNKS